MEGRIHPPSHELGAKSFRNACGNPTHLLRLPKFGCKDTKKCEFLADFCNILLPLHESYNKQITKKT